MILTCKDCLFLVDIALTGVFMNTMASTSGATPRKFAEKIAMHNQKGAEEEEEFRKIMSECAAVKTGHGANIMQPQPPHQRVSIELLTTCLCRS